MNGTVLNWRGLSASIASVVAIFGLVHSLKNDWYILSLALVLLATAAVVIHVGSLGAQILARAVWWSNLALGVVITILASGSDQSGGLGLALGCGAALLVVGNHRLASATSAAGYVPAALRGMLLLLMVFALADAQTFLLFGSIDLIDGKWNRLELSFTMLPIGIAYVAGFVGLYRLQIWGAIVSITTSAVVLALLGLTSLFHEIDKLQPFLAVLAIVHIVTATPVTIAALRGKQLVSISPQLRRVVASVVTAGLMLLASVVWLANR